MSECEQKLRDQLIKVWGKLGEGLLEPIGTVITEEDAVALFNEITETLNNTDPDLKSLSSRMRATYETYLPIETLRELKIKFPNIFK